MRSLQSMLIKASTLGHNFEIVSEGESLYVGKNPRDAYQILRNLEEARLYLVNTELTIVDMALVTPGEADAYICDCWCNGFFDNWEI